MIRLHTRLVLLVLVVFASAAFTSAQKTEGYVQTEEIYYHAVELYNKEIFGPAIEEFDRFIELDHLNDLMKAKAEVYSMLAHLQLEHRNYDKKLDKHLKSAPQTSLNNLAIFELGNYYFNHKKYKKTARYYEDLAIGNLPKEYWEEANFKMGYSFFKAKDY